VVCMVCALLLASCASPSRKEAVPTALADRASVFNDPSIRTWDDTLSPAFLERIFDAGKKEFDLRSAAGQAGPLPTAYFLGISGGGANGAYGAGLLCGWTAAGTRPEFKIVTGISTGALTAPFAFLGPAYDDKLRRVYTSVTTDQVATSRNLLAALFDDAMMDTLPLRKLLIQLVDKQMMLEIAREYARGRILMVATTNLDANRGVIWNIGQIAASNDPKALDLIPKRCTSTGAPKLRFSCTRQPLHSNRRSRHRDSTASASPTSSATPGWTPTGPASSAARSRSPGGRSPR